MDFRSSRAPLFAGLGFAWFFTLIIANSWVGDDAFILYRSMEQLLAGNGPVWNPHERVQVYTGVIWFWLGYLVRQLTDDYFLLMLFMSATCCAAMLALLRRWVANDAAWLVLVLVLSTSRGLVDFSTSGLGHSLINLVAVAFMLLWLSVALSPTPRNLVRMFLLASIVPLVRHDMALLVAPACLHAMWVCRRAMSPGRWLLLLLAAALPLLCWTAFSLAYYGFPFPNTYYAKAARDIPRLDLVVSGVEYYLAAFMWDPATLLFTFAGLALMLRAKMAPLVAGVALHMAYVLWVGGDFMLTRFLVADFVVAVSGAAVVLLGGVRVPRPPTVGVLAALVIAAAGLAVAWNGIDELQQGAPYQGMVDLGQEGALADAMLSPAIFLFVLCLWGLVRGLLVSNKAGRTHGRKAKGKNRIEAMATNSTGIRMGRRDCMVAVAALLVYSIADPYSPARHYDRTYILFGVLDERAAYAGDTSLHAWIDDKSGSRGVGTDRELFNRMAVRTGLPDKNEIGYPYGRLADAGNLIGKMFDVAAIYAVGMQGLAAGTEPILLDLVGLGDAYLARTRFNGKVSDVIRSHWYASLPRRYTQRLVDGEDAPWGKPGTFEGDLELAVKSDELFTKERWAALARLNLGMYDVVSVQDPLEARYYSNSSPVLNPQGGGQYVGQEISSAFRAPLAWHHDSRRWLPIPNIADSYDLLMPKVSGD